MALEWFNYDHTHFTFGKHISFSVFKQKFIVMFLTLILVLRSLPVLLYWKVVEKYSVCVCVCVWWHGVEGGRSGKDLAQGLFSFACIKFT